MKVDDIVRIKDPMPDEDGRQTYRVVELRGDRVLVEAKSGFEDWRVRPTFVFKRGDLKLAVRRRR